METEKTIRQYLTNRLKSLGVKTMYAGFAPAIEGAIYILPLLDRPSEILFTKDVYPYIAKKLNRDSDFQVERNIRTISKIIWSHDRNKAFFQKYLANITECPTASELVSALAYAAAEKFGL